jgi:hypothetical protein
VSNPDNDFAKVFEKIKQSRTAITDKHGKDRGYQGEIDCPCCGTGKLRYSCASNGHIHARCTTYKCTNWME